MNYDAFGLRLSSSIPLPELIPAESDSTADIEIQIGEIGAGITAPTHRGLWWKTAPNAFEIQVPGTARYLVLNGNQITIEPEKEATSIDMRTYLLGSAMGALLHQRRLLPLHASSFVYHDSAVLIGGKSGAGKSTVLKGFQTRGYPAMSDDTTAVSLSPHGSLIASAAFPSTRLCADATNHFNADLPPASEHLHAGSKQIFKLTHFDPAPRRISHIFLLKTHSFDRITSEALSGIAAMDALTYMTTRKNYLLGMGLRASHFGLITQLATSVRVTQILHPVTLSSLPHLLDEITAYIETASSDV